MGCHISHQATAVFSASKLQAGPFWVAASGFKHHRFPNHSLFDLFLGCHIPSIKMTHEPDLKFYSGCTYSSEGLITILQAECQRLFAKNMFSRRCGGLDNFGVRVGWRGNDDCLDIFALQQLAIVVIGRQNPKTSRHLACRASMSVCDSHKLSFCNAVGQMVGKCCAHTTGAN
jgi:hypothetical protein